MADITDITDQTSPQDLDDNSVGNGSAPSESRGVKRQRPTPADDDDDDDEKGGRERRKIEIKFITDKSRRHITFSKRKAGIMKKVRHHAQFSPLRVTTDVTWLRNSKKNRCGFAFSRQVSAKPSRIHCLATRRLSAFSAFSC